MCYDSHLSWRPLCASQGSEAPSFKKKHKEKLAQLWGDWTRHRGLGFPLQVLTQTAGRRALPLGLGI